MEEIKKDDFNDKNLEKEQEELIKKAKDKDYELVDDNFFDYLKKIEKEQKS